MSWFPIIMLRDGTGERCATVGETALLLPFVIVVVLAALIVRDWHVVKSTKGAR